MSARPNYKYFVLGEDTQLGIFLETAFGAPQLKDGVLFLPTETEKINGITTRCSSQPLIYCKDGDQGTITRYGYPLSEVAEFTLVDDNNNKLVWRRTSDGWGNFSLYPVDTSGQIGQLGHALNAVVAPNRISSYVQLGVRQRVET